MVWSLGGEQESVQRHAGHLEVYSFQSGALLHKRWPRWNGQRLQLVGNSTHTLPNQRYASHVHLPTVYCRGWSIGSKHLLSLFRLIVQKTCATNTCPCLCIVLHVNLCYSNVQIQSLFLTL